MKYNKLIEIRIKINELNEMISIEIKRKEK
jgi:hypothetical protein